MTIKTAKINLSVFSGLEKFISSPTNPKFFFTMTEINKVGINPRSGYETPLGVYCYPLTKEYYEKLLTNKLPFAGNKPYVNVFTLNVSTFNMTSYTEADLKRDMNTLKWMYGIKGEIENIAAEPKYPPYPYVIDSLPEEEKKKQLILYDAKLKEYDIAQNKYNSSFNSHENIFVRAIREARGGTPIAKFWNLTRLLARGSKNWNYLMRKLGYTNFSDPNTGLIHPSEPTQTVILDPTIIVPIETFYNPYASYVKDMPHLPTTDKKMLQQKEIQKEKNKSRISEIKNPKALDKLARSQLQAGSFVDMSLIISIVGNNNTSSETLRFINDNLTDDNRTNTSILDKLATNKNTPIDIVIKNLNDMNSDYIYDIMERPDVTTELLKSIITNNTSTAVKKAIANSDKADKEILIMLISDPLNMDAGLLSCIIKNTKCSHSIYNLFSSPDEPSYIKQIVAENDTTPQDILLKLAKDTSSAVRQSVIRSKNVPKEVFYILATDKDNYIKELLVSNNKTPPEVLDMLVRDKDVTTPVKNGIAYNPHSTKETLRLLFTDKMSDTTIYGLSKNPNFPEEMLHKLLEAASKTNNNYAHEITMNVARYNTNYDILKYLSADKDISIRKSVANNEKAPMDILEQLTNDSDLNVSSFAHSQIDKRHRQEKQNKKELKDEEFKKNIQEKYKLSSEGELILSIGSALRYDDFINATSAYFTKEEKAQIHKMIEDGLLVGEMDMLRINNEITKIQPVNSEKYTIQDIKEKYKEFEYSMFIKELKDSVISGTPIYDSDFNSKTQKLISTMVQEGYLNINENGKITLGTKKEASLQDTTMLKTADKEEKIPLSQIKKMPYKSLNRMIKKMREYLKNNEVMQKMFKEYKVDISEIDLIPMMFGNLDVSAKTDHGIIIFNYKLLTDGDFFKDFSYGVHEMTHWLQQTTGSKATKSSDDGSYLHNKFEQEGFANQIEYIDDQFGNEEAEQYVDDLLEHHEVKNESEKDELKDILMEKI